MKIGINSTYISQKNKTGIENYSTAVILKLLEYDKENFYSLFSQLKLESNIIKNNPKVQIFQSSFTRGWHTFRLPLSLLRHPVDIFFDPGYTIPPFVKIPTISVVHDLAFKHFPNAYSKSQLISQNASFELLSKNASGIIFTSLNTKKDFFEFYPSFVGRSKVLYQSYDNDLYSSQNFAKKLPKNIPNKYILSIGRLEKRKNIVNLVKSYIKMRQSNPSISEKLLLIGMPGFGYEEISKEISKSGKYKDDIIELGYVDKEFLPSIYSKSSLFVFPTLYEGFGIPILEAFASGVPVVCSKSSSLPEVAGNAAIFFDPENVSDIAEKIASVLKNNDLCKNMIVQGKSQLTSFTWDNLCQDLLIFFKEVYESRNNS